MSSPARVALVGGDAPRQVLLALGVVPYRLYGSWTAPVSDEASSLLGAVDVVTQRILDEILGGIGDVAGIIVSNDSMANLRLFYVLRLLHADGGIPHPVHLLDVPSAPGAPRLRFTVWQYEQLAAFVGGRVGGGLSVGALEDAAEQERAVGRALGRLRALRSEGAVRASEVLSMACAAGRRSPADFAATVSQVHPERLDTRLPALMITGSAHPDNEVYRLIESEGFRIVGDDHDCGDGQWIGDAVSATDTGSILRGLAELHMGRAPRASRSRSGQRAGALARRVQDAGADAVLGLVRAEDHAPAWDLPAQRAGISIPLVSRTQIGPTEVGDATRAALAELRTMSDVRAR